MRKRGKVWLLRERSYYARALRDYIETVTAFDALPIINFESKTDKMAELKLLSDHSKATEIKQLSGYPRLKPAFILKVSLFRII